jgi:hypothetical protein
VKSTCWLLVTVLGLAAGCGTSRTGAPPGSATTTSTGSTVSVTTATPLRTTVTVATTPTATTAVVSTTTATTSPATSIATVAPAQSPEEAIGPFLHPERYAGDCVTADMERDVGAYCSKLLADRGDQRVYAMGLAFSEVSFYLLLERHAGGWVVTGTAPFDQSVGVVSPW